MTSSQPQQVTIPPGGSVSMPWVGQITMATISSLPTNAGPVTVANQILVPTVPPMSGPCGANLVATIWCNDLSSIVLRGAAGDGVSFVVQTP